MDNREAGLIEMFERIKIERINLGLVSFLRTPTRPTVIGDLPCVFMIEGVDRIEKRSNRNKVGYPATRIMEVHFESVVNKRASVNIKTLNKNLRQAIFKIRGSIPIEYSSVIAVNTFIQENRTEGPFGYGLPDVEAMRLVIDLTYIDGGL